MIALIDAPENEPEERMASDDVLLIHTDHDHGRPVSGSPNKQQKPLGAATLYAVEIVRLYFHI